MPLPIMKGNLIARLEVPKVEGDPEGTLYVYPFKNLPIKPYSS